LRRPVNVVKTLLNINAVVLLAPILLMSFLILFIFAISSNPSSQIDPENIGYYVQYGEKYNLDWATLMMIDAAQKREFNPSQLEKDAEDLSNYIKKNGVSIDVAINKVIFKDLNAAQGILAAATEFKPLEPMIFNHRYPMNINRMFNQQDTYGKVIPGLWDTPHNGVDISASLDTPLLAVAEATVVHLTRAGDGGIGITLQDRSDASIMYYYAHMNRYGEHIDVGQTVQLNSVVGYVGHTGHATGDHLHFMIFKDGKHIDPTLYLKYWKSMDAYYKRKKPELWADRLIKNPNVDGRVIQNIVMAYSLAVAHGATVTLPELLYPYLYLEY
jgi:peptidoglycan LD-endopeptidase LytH